MSAYSVTLVFVGERRNSTGQQKSPSVEGPSECGLALSEQALVLRIDPVNLCVLVAEIFPDH
jgi:hypothetical protein